MNAFDNTLLKEEFEFIFGRKGSGVRRATVTAAFMEWQIIDLARHFLEEHKVMYKPEPHQEYSQSLSILKANNVISAKEAERIATFRKERNKSVHGIFKGMTRPEWDKQNKHKIELGKPIIKLLNEKLYPSD